MIKKVLRKLERLNAEKSKFITEQSDIQKNIDNIDNEIKIYTNLKKDYEKLEKKYNDLANSPEVKKNERAR